MGIENFRPSRPSESAPEPADGSYVLEVLKERVRSVSSAEPEPTKDEFDPSLVKPLPPEESEALRVELQRMLKESQ